MWESQQQYQRFHIMLQTHPQNSRKIMSKAKPGSLQWQWYLSRCCQSDKESPWSSPLTQVPPHIRELQVSVPQFSVPLADSKDQGGEPRETGTFAGKHWQVLVWKTLSVKILPLTEVITVDKQQGRDQGQNLTGEKRVSKKKEMNVLCAESSHFNVKQLMKPQESEYQIYICHAFLLLSLNVRKGRNI